MQVLKNERIIFCDVDDTLVMHRTFDPNEEGVESVVVADPTSNHHLLLEVNKNMVRLVKEEHGRGGTIIVWSRGGYAWAESVVHALKLESYVHTVMSKPPIYFDDKPVQEWLTDRVYIGPDINYKSNKVDRSQAV